MFWGTGGDGAFNLEVALNQDVGDEDRLHVASKSINNKLVSLGSLILGSPESIGSTEKKALDDEYIKEIPLTNGIYSVDVFFIYNEIDEEKTRFYINLKSVDETYVFPNKVEFPTLG